MEQNTGKLNIVLAVYGLKVVTEKIANLVIDDSIQTLNFTVNNIVIEDDGWRGQRKSILILYNYDGGELQTYNAKEGDNVVITPDRFKNLKPIQPNKLYGVDNNKISIIAASYGPDDVTYKVRNLISTYNTLSFKVDNEVFGDTWYGVAKTLVIVLGHEEEIEAVEIFTERENCYIDLNDAVPAI